MINSFENLAFLLLLDSNLAFFVMFVFTLHLFLMIDLSTFSGAQWRTQDFSMGGFSKVTSKICSQSILWQINNLVQCYKMESKSHRAQCK